MPDMLHFNIFF